MDDVLIDAPYMITREMLASMRVSVVLTGKPHDTIPAQADGSSSGSIAHGSHQHEYNPLLSVDPYTVPQSMGILHTLDRKHTMSVFDILAKIEEQKESLSKKFDRKRAQEQEFYARKYGNII